MDEEYIGKDPAVNGLSAKGKNFTEQDKALLRDTQRELLAAVLPEYRLAEEDIVAWLCYHAASRVLGP